MQFLQAAIFFFPVFIFNSVRKREFAFFCFVLVSLVGFVRQGFSVALAALELVQ